MYILQFQSSAKITQKTVVNENPILSKFVRAENKGSPDKFRSRISSFGTAIPSRSVRDLFAKNYIPKRANIYIKRSSNMQYTPISDKLSKIFPRIS